MLTIPNSDCYSITVLNKMRHIECFNSEFSPQVSVIVASQFGFL